MENETSFLSKHGANWSAEDNLQEETSVDYILPPELTELSESSLFGVLAYGVVFVVAVLGHIFVLTSLWKRYKVKKTRIYLLLLHLSLADLIVCLVIVPTEIFWRLIVQWEGGTFLCKATQFLRAFGLYLSSLILICLSVDRFISIIFPLKAIGAEAYRRIKLKIAVAWVGAALFSAPQTVFFSVESHPRYPRFRQCVTSAFYDEDQFHKVKIYSIFSIMIMYFVPLLVVAITYTAIFVKLAIKSREHTATSSLVQTYTEYQHSTSVITIVNEGGVVSTTTERTRSTFQLRSSSNAQVNLTKAKMRTLLMTIVIVFAFVVCWTPYAVMTIWYIVDWEEAENVDARIQDALFLMVVANSCLNPLIYGGFSRKPPVRNRSSCSFF